ncbi:ComF family protein [Sandaracinomonas limnophila]|uniref:ComF family protein n=1 Tax=Sandaracinomonas limnophila TaxID=1862386 RepID=A0A437PM45_9BACT|nr:phosphoribosyltransferase family protein [Sandaracinomonas limnophila]RVU23358.1 ComF family protein [Sandaracinomonas limnophila]
MFTFILQLIYPKQCCACQQTLLLPQEFICLDCQYALPRYDFRAEKSNYLLEKFDGELPISSFFTYAWFSAGGHMQHIMHQIKYKGNVKLAQKMGVLLGKAYADEWSNLGINGIVPIPLHPKRFKARGYNQAAEIAKGVSNYLNVPLLEHALIRTKHGESLVSQNRQSRFEQLNNCFELGSENVMGKRIVLLDDTLTTGATCIAAGKELWKGGILDLSLASLAVVR